MKLSSITRGKVASPIKAVVYGRPGVGKSTLASQAPSPIFLGAEDGTKQLDVARFPLATKMEEIEGAIESLTVEDHDFRTLVIDTLDSIEPLVHDAALARSCERASSFAEIGYGKGPMLAVDQWRKLLNMLDGLARVRGMGLVLIAHSQRKTMQDPTSADYDRFTLKLADKTNALITGWADCVLFACTNDTVKSTTKKQVAIGDHELVTRQQPGLDAKSRYPFEERIPMTWAAIETVVPHCLESVDALVCELLALTAPEKLPQARKWLAQPRSREEIQSVIDQKRKKG